MALPDETSTFCETCSSFNIQEGIIKDGKIYCNSCVEMGKVPEVGKCVN